MGVYRAARHTVVQSTTDLESQAALVTAFFEEYEQKHNFPDDDEREDPEVIKQRIRSQEAGHPSGMFTHLLAVELEREDGTWVFGGGMVIEFYPLSSCGLLTYVFVAKALRGHQSLQDGSRLRVADFLFNHNLGLPQVVESLRAKYATVSTILFESNHAARTDPEEDSMPPHKRLRFFRSIGAKRTPCAYVQPPLEEGKSPVTNLMLNCFPRYQADPKGLDLRDVMVFLMELTTSLDENMEPRIYEEDVFMADVERMRTVSAGGLADLRLTGVTYGGHNLLQDMLDSLVRSRTDGFAVSPINIPIDPPFPTPLDGLRLRLNVPSAAALPSTFPALRLAFHDEWRFSTPEGETEAHCFIFPETVDARTCGLSEPHQRVATAAGMPKATAEGSAIEMDISALTAPTNPLVLAALWLGRLASVSLGSDESAQAWHPIAKLPQLLLGDAAGSVAAAMTVEVRVSVKLPDQSGLEALVTLLRAYAQAECTEMDVTPTSRTLVCDGRRLVLSSTTA
ncbi:uncharacterized protein MONBRDRAFT_37314 [Monosiga brevicollis MX1]|uniref:Uncharacterized protein n=1 Tax=Monosiga brevicollis TaxID=81824 RepID=A9V0Z2_MONBE|nr:uncharacterized protein MONBRDRAFT_37314 [Monosiga brevicollis MX1]EDQ88841.1 predicted protein [Monosiga brevicollis MX1]|eukprot:XP_001746454.1 hypothetical protein [Monosiga brevicollis MX1]